MKVILSAADTGSLKLAEFTKKTNSSDPNCTDYQVSTLIASPQPKSKLKYAIIHSCFIDDKIAYIRRNGDVYIETNLIGSLETGCAIFFSAKPRCLVVFGSSGVCKVFELKDLNLKTEFEVPIKKDLTVFCQNRNNLLQFGAGSKSVLPLVFDLDFKNRKVTNIWESDPLPDTILDLPEPNNVTCMTFVNEEGLVVGSSHGKLRMYKIGTNEMKEFYAQLDAKSITADQESNTVIVGDSKSTVAKYSLPDFKLRGTYKDVEGSTRAIKVLDNYVAIGGIDRYLRVFELESRKLCGKVYIGDQIWDLLFLSHDGNEDMKDMDEMWAGIESKASSQSKSQVKSQGKRGAVKSDDIEQAQPRTKKSRKDSLDDETFNGFD